MDNLLDDYYFAERHYVEQRIRLERKIKALNIKELLMNDQIDQVASQFIPKDEVYKPLETTKKEEAVTVQDKEVTGIPAVI